ncbi:Redoxin family protein [uncultured Eubacteriales bacterium]|uniref:Redoxin family protein n=1 Tax=uncultured Eubacteriales bacterium TaxID=172733 RepID=A0A212JL47_9FIRM|nr:Redoxin family protein [uncultured Eubacteriales bacterium]
MSRRFALFLAALLALALLSACAGSTAPAGDAASPSPSVPVVAPSPTPAPDQGEDAETSAGVMSSFSATDLDGDPIDQSIFEDYDLTMVNIWATFCGPCLNEMPDLGAIHAEYADKGFQIVGLVADTLNQDGTISESQVDTAKAAVEETGADYLHILPSQDLFGILSQATSVPTTFFVDKNGAQVGYAYLGSREKNDWIAIIDPLLEEVRE